ncbi:3-oxoacyl-ACP reductase FabG [Acidiferrobacter sp.]|uniref:3-oxoacyl-ACP reductase FabG n=1 Tax=Acidiferrobacter sp. TaxID=1872107 RepID=UPI0026389B43|nr:3-oxoacyl-ACP reductase FabG [Acidiferrobacter sp.]
MTDRPATAPGPRRALVTGASGAIGAEICRRLAADGWRVICQAHGRPADAERLVSELGALGAAADLLVCDLADEQGVATALAPFLAQGPIQVLVHNAGVHDDAVLAGMTAAQWHRPLDVCLNGFFHVARPLLLPMIRTRWGRIVNVTSVAGILGNRGQANYAAAKAGLHAAGKSLALEVASRGVTVNSVAPGIIATPMSHAFSADDIARLVPMGRAGECREVADLIGFLVSDQAGYITGQVISINGGMI